MEIIVKIEKKLNERSGVSKQSGKAWKASEFLASTLPEGRYEADNIVFDVTDNDKGRVKEFEDSIGKVVRVGFTIEARCTEQGRWFNSVKGWYIKNV